MSTHVCSFSGSAASLRGCKRNREHVLAALRRDPKLSVWDLSEYTWLRRIVDDLRRTGDIAYSDTLDYPWQAFTVRPQPCQTESSDSRTPGFRASK